MKEKVTLIRLTSEQLRKIRGGYTMSAIGNPEGRISREELILMARRAKLISAQLPGLEAAIYQRGARENYDSPTLQEGTTYCNQHSYDVMEATGVHMEAFYGNKNRYNVNANKACQNVRKYINDWANTCVGNTIRKMKQEPHIPDYVINKNNISFNQWALYQEALAQCPIQEISADEAQKLANQGYTVVAMWENPNKVKDENGNWQEVSGHMAMLRPDYAPYDSKAGPLVSNVGDKIVLRP